MNVMTFTYEYGDEDREITMLVASYDDLGRPVGYEVSEVEGRFGWWVLDDTPTTVIHPIRVVVTVGKVNRVAIL